MFQFTLKKHLYAFAFSFVAYSLFACPLFAEANAASVNKPYAISHGQITLCAIFKDKVQCYGDNKYGLWDGPQGLKNPRQISTGAAHACVLTDDGVKCWGGKTKYGNAYGYPNYGDHGQANVPAGLKDPTQVVTGSTHSCALTAEGVRCWGSNEFGETQVPPLKGPYFLAAGSSHTCAITNEGVKCWGRNNYGQLDVPPGLRSPRHLSAGDRHTCAVTLDGVQCWGAKLKLGYPSACVIGSCESNQVDVPQGLKNPTEVAAGFDHTCALTDEGVKCWGSNTHGQLNADWQDLRSPSKLTAGGNTTCAITLDGLRCWGFTPLNW